VNVASASGVPPYTIDRHQLACHESSNVKSPCHIPTFASQLTDEWSLSTRHTIQRPALSARPISLDHGLQSVLPNSLDHGLQVYLQTHSITASKFAQSWPPSAFLNSLDHSLHVYSKLAQLRSPSSHNHGLQGHL